MQTAQHSHKALRPRKRPLPYTSRQFLIETFEELEKYTTLSKHNTYDISNRNKNGDMPQIVPLPTSLRRSQKNYHNASLLACRTAHRGVNWLANLAEIASPNRFTGGF
jgi:hypothetical protein